MIELKLSTVNASILLATSRYFGELAQAVQGAQTSLPASAVFDIQTPAAVEITPEVVATVSNVLPLPLPTNNAEAEEVEEEAEEDAAPAVTLSAHGVEVDADGYPWDHRIHASTKTKISNGTWKIKPRTDAALVDKVRAEFDRAAAAPALTAPAIVPPAAAVEPAPTQPAPTANPIAPIPPTANTDKPSNPALLFTSTLSMYAQAEREGKVQAGSGDAWAKQVGLPSMASLITRPDLCGQFYDQLKALLV